MGLTYKRPRKLQSTGMQKGLVSNRSFHLQWMKIIVVVVVFLAGLNACSDRVWNNPYPVQDDHGNILYQSFSSRPKYLDPVRSYSSNEDAIIANIYEPPLQYHYLKRPHALVPMTATRVPAPYHLDKSGHLLPDDAPMETVAYSIYEIEIQKGILYQPHPYSL